MTHAELRGEVDADHVLLTPVGYEGDTALVSRSLAPLVDPQTVGSNAAMPTVVPLSGVMDISAPAWDGDSTRSVEILLGLAPDGVVHLDLFSDGPHALIGGTTGAGKSELLQAIACSLIHRYSPHEVSLFLVDYKAGSTFGEFARLPHVSGFVSDVDGANIARAIRFLRAEIRRRQTCFRDADNAKEYPDYRAWQRRNSPQSPTMPRLVVMFDEFATLVRSDETSRSKSPSMDAVIDIAQRGRSYGIHLVLATQSPRPDVIGASVRANVRAQIALATLTREESMIIIDSGEAALIPRSRPGRALLRLEGTTLIEFQTPFAGAEVTRSRAQSTISISPLFHGSVRMPGEVSTRVSDTEGEHEDPLPKEFQVLVDAVVGKWSEREESPDLVEEGASGAAHADNMLLDMQRLSKPLTDMSVEEVVDAGEIDIGAVGVIDLPQLQEVRPLTVDWSGAIILEGSGGTGKTTGLVQLAETWAADKPSPIVFGIDGGNGGLQRLIKERGHSWSVVDCADSVEVSRLIDLIGMCQGVDHEGLLLIVDEIERLRLFMEDARAGTDWSLRLSEALRFARTMGISLLVSSRTDLWRQLVGEGSTVLRLGENFAQFGLAREDWKPLYALTEAGDTARLYGLSDCQQPMRSVVHLPEVKRRDVTEISRRDGVGFDICLGTEDILNRRVWVDLEKDGVLVISRDSKQSAEILSTLVFQVLERIGDGLPLLSECPPAGYEGVCWFDQAAIMGAVNQSGDELTPLLSATPLAKIGQRFVVVNWAGERTMSPTFTAVVERLNGAGLLCLIWVSPPGQGVRDAVRLLGERRATFVVQPSPVSDGSELSSAVYVRLQHRPRVRYKPGQGILLDGEGQHFVWALSGLGL